MTEAKYKNMWTFLIETNCRENADIGSDMRCTICKKMLINAQKSVCVCRYCLECVKAYLNGVKRICPGNTVFCKTAELDIDRNISIDQEINLRISKWIVKCRYSCGFRCALREMEDHEIKCQKQPVDCPYVNVGCGEVELGSDNIGQHLVRENESHARLLMTCIETLKSEISSVREINEVRARKTNEMTGQIKQEVANLWKENKLAKEKYIKRCQATEKDLAEIWCEMKMQREKLEKRVSKIGLNTEMQNYGEFVWSIDRWAERSQSARNGSCDRIFSEAFYTHKNGYKMCLSVWPGGWGSGKGIYLSVFFSLMQGPFDNILPWPFKRVVTLSLIDQNTGIDLFSRTGTYDDSPNSIAWNKPVTERNRGIGTYDLVQLTTLSSITGLYQDDRIFIKCVVK